MAWATANVALIWPMPGPDDGIDVNNVVTWNNPALAALPLPGGNVVPAPPPLPPVPAAGAAVAAAAPDLSPVLNQISGYLRDSFDMVLDTKLRESWMTLGGVVGNFLVVDPAIAVSIAGGPIYPWRGGGVAAPVDRYFALNPQDLAEVIENLIPAGREVREVIFALSNFEDEGGLSPARSMGVIGQRGLNQWRFHAGDDLKKHLLWEFGGVYIQVILRTPFALPVAAPRARTPTTSGVFWE